MSNKPRIYLAQKSKSEKTLEMDKVVDGISKTLFGRKRFEPSVVDTISEGLQVLFKCSTCGSDVDPAVHFKDALSLKEFGISGMCQKCQDDTFKEPYEDNNSVF